MPCLSGAGASVETLLDARHTQQNPEPELGKDRPDRLWQTAAALWLCVWAVQVLGSGSAMESWTNPAGRWK